ncbi:MAG: GNAT family N-acetyltransferase [Acidimicrobiales bacterium]
MRWDRSDGYFVSDERASLDLKRVHRWLSEASYWAKGRSFDDVRASFARSLPLGLYSRDGELVGVCRWVTDRVSFAWLCDVFVDESVRGRGLGTFLVECASSVDQVRGVGLHLLATRDAHGLYERSGFRPVSPGRFMERRREPPPSASASGEAHPPDWR